VAAPAPRVLAAALLERDDLVATPMLQHLGGDGRAGHRGEAEGRAVTAHHQHLAELDDLTGLALDLFDLELVAGGHPVLLSAGLDDCEHRSFSVFDPGTRL